MLRSIFWHGIAVILVAALAACDSSSDSDSGGDDDSDNGPVGPITQNADISPSKDNTLYEHTMNPAEWSNGAGQYMFSGQIGAMAVAPLGPLRRALIAFDIAGVVPANATITGATLRLNVSRARNVGANVALHRLLVNWGEGGSDAPGNEAGGANGANPDGSTLPDAEPNEATWTHRLHDGGAAGEWDNLAGGAPGADYETDASATQSVTSAGSYTWSSATLVSDVQFMLDNPAANFGWMIIGEEATAFSVKRYDTREHPTVANRPLLTIEYTTPP